MLSHTLFRYLLIGAFTFGLDLALLTAVRSGLGWPLPVAVTIGYAVALSVNYALNRVLNFHSHAPLGPESLRYAGAVAVNFGVVLLGVTTGLAAVGVPYQVARVAAGGAEGIFMYCAMRWFVFAVGRRDVTTMPATMPAMIRSVRLSADDLDRLVRRLRAAGCVFAEEEAALLAEAATSADELEALAARRAAGEPLEQLLGWVEFCGLRLAVAPGVFVPRQRTALLVDEVVALVRPGSVVVDLGCGVGAIAAAVLARVPGVEVYAVDVDPAAVACARRNLPAGAGLRGRPLRRTAGRPARRGRRGGGQRAVRPDRGDRADAARGPRPRAPRRAGRRSRRARGAAPGDRGALRRGCGRAATCWWRPAGASSTARAQRSGRPGSRSRWSPTTSPEGWSPGGRRTPTSVWKPGLARI